MYIKNYLDGAKSLINFRLMYLGTKFHIVKSVHSFHLIEKYFYLPFDNPGSLLDSWSILQQLNICVCMGVRWGR